MKVFNPPPTSHVHLVTRTTTRTSLRLRKSNLSSRRKWASFHIGILVFDFQVINIISVACSTRPAKSSLRGIKQFTPIDPSAITKFLLGHGSEGGLFHQYHF
ncbi:hypothetical protein BJX65DRAFT_114843 [Aspergillus insuetus]